MWEIAKTIEDLPVTSNLECPICYQQIDINEVYKGTPNCKVCVNGHRWHSYCHSLDSFTPSECPLCRSTDVKFCKFRDGYMYNKKGGKRRKTRSKKHRSRKYRKNKKTIRKLYK